MADYYSIITNRGKELEAEALASGTVIVLSWFVVGDGNGKLVKPNPAQTRLVNETYRGSIAELVVSPEQSNQLMAKIVLPTDTGGFTVREVGLLTDAGELYAVANCPTIDKPVGGVSVNMQFRLAVSDTSNITLDVATGDGLFLRIDQNLKEIKARGAAAQKESRESIGVVDATTKQKGLVQLNSATNSTSEIQAATPAAVKAVNDNANTRVPSTRKVNGYALSSDVVLSADDVDAIPVEIVGVINDNKTIASANKTGWWRVAVSNTATISDFPTFPGGVKLYGYGYLFVDLSSGSWLQHYYSHRGQNAKRQGWDGPLPTPGTSWVIEYNTANKPTPEDIGALPISGGQLTGGLGLHRGILFFPESAYKNKAEGLTGTYATDALDYRWELYARSKANSSIRSNIFTVDIIDISKGSTASGGGSNNTTTITFHGRIVTPFAIQPGDWSNFDARYQAKGNYTPAGQAYTKTESDGRFQPKGSYTPAGEAYTKAQSDARYLQGIRVSATQVREFRDGGGYSSNDAAFATAIAMVGGSSNVGSLLVRYLQRNINGTWVNVAT
ncbi:phage tail protein [Citrobacter koseri]|uniref:phage tail protein n=1 Tax=Citrobacter koseri TaxID=545 RepID=UPI000AC6F0A7|nr:phage tail protein [Citrobacter koseri]STA77360.1 phage tail fiber protein [Citrobacter koseri]STB37599.1 phage tail fiber protein [Citrobacter koseri]STB73529.1 phage tail fiber protein [Citrobacter koseri]STT22315.1 putative prophage tail fiber protein [Citrobacter koseri]STT23707.1 putative prophage tail fiber protein [Citrobacter koseri]